MSSKKHTDKRPRYSKLEYQEVYLKSEHWQKVKRRMYRTFRACELCKKRGVRLNIHHITYNRLGNEDTSDLIVLCEDCHINKVHAGLVTQKELFNITGGSKSGRRKIPKHVLGKKLGKQKGRRFSPGKKKHVITSEQIEGRLKKKLGTIAYYRMKREQAGNL